MTLFRKTVAACSKLALLFCFLSFSTSLAFASTPKVKNSELSGHFAGQSVNGSCQVKMKRNGDILVLTVHQNMTTNISLPVSVTALLQKISGDQCGGAKYNNACGEYSINDNIQMGAGYDNSLTVSAQTIQDQRCLEIQVEDSSHGQWVGQNYCRINLNRSGKGCPDKLF